LFIIITLFVTRQIFERLKEMLGIRLNPETPIALLATGNFTLVRGDIDSFVDTYREPPILSQALASMRLDLICVIYFIFFLIFIFFLFDFRIRLRFYIYVMMVLFRFSRDSPIAFHFAHSLWQ
jgi:hypothetical protein